MYKKFLSIENPGLILFMLDQSLAMSELTTLAINRSIGEIIIACSSGYEIKNRCYVAAISYGSKTKVLFLKTASELAQNTNTKTLKKSIPDGAGGLVEIDEVMRIFISPIVCSGTAMAEAFRETYYKVENFITYHSDSYPPMIINIVQGEPSDFNSAEIEAKKLTQLKTSDGNVILINVHISNILASKIEFPSNNSSFQNNQLANFLFNISSVLPQPFIENVKNVGFSIQSNSKGFIFNGDSESLIKLLQFGSQGALR